MGKLHLVESNEQNTFSIGEMYDQCKGQRTTLVLCACFYILVTSTFTLRSGSMHSWQLYGAASLTGQSTGIMTRFLPHLHYPAADLTSIWPMLVLQAIAKVARVRMFLVIGLRRPGIELLTFHLRGSYTTTGGLCNC